MHCLSIPVDHRLQQLIRGGHRHTNIETSNHVQILRKFGGGIRTQYQDDEHLRALPAKVLDFCLELARPEEKGGVTILLYHPDPSQTYEHGFTSEEARCATLAAVKDLVISSTLGTMDTDAVTILDSMPFMEEDFSKNDSLHTRSHETLIKLLLAKQPSVILSCFFSGSNKGFLRLIRHGGIGIENDEQSFSLPGTDQNFTKVSAFHPSYAVNYHPYESCFRRLLILQFAKAFAIWRSGWVEKPFMQELRQTCLSTAARYKACKGENDLRNLIYERFGEIVSSLSSRLADLEYFDLFSDWSSTKMIETLIKSNLTWLLCDCGLFIRECHKDNLIDLQLLCDHFESWIERLTRASATSSEGEVGLVEHSLLLGKRSALLNPVARDMQNLLFTWLRQLNLGFTRVDQSETYDLDPEALADAMLRLASCMEHRFARWSSGALGHVSLVPDFEGMTVGHDR